MVFGVGECDVGGRFPWIEVTKAELQTDEEKALPVLEMLAAPVYRGETFVCKRCQTHRSDFQIGQVT